MKVEKANTPEYKAYVSEQIDAWTRYIYRQEMSNDSYYAYGQNREDEEQLRYWQSEMRELIANGQDEAVK